MESNVQEIYGVVLEPRSLEAKSEIPTLSPNESSGDDLVQSNDTEIILETLRIYGSIYGLFFLAFCVLRRRYPKLFNIRSWVPEMKCDLAITQSYGFFSWVWKVRQVDDDVLLKYIGMDGLCFIRCLRLGSNLSFCGLLNSLWLIPMFLTAEKAEETAYLTDLFAKMSVANLPSTSPRFAGVVVAAYVQLFCSLYLISKEYDWYITYRHKFLSQRISRNYAIYVSGIPEDLRSNYALADFFRNCSWDSAVVEAQMAMDIPSIEPNVARREKLIAKLEHVMAEERIKGIVKTHRTFKLKNTASKEKVTEVVKSVDAYQKELRHLNNEICLAIGKVTNHNHRLRHHMTKNAASSNILRGRALSEDTCLAPTENVDEDDDRFEMFATEQSASTLGQLEPIMESSPTNRAAWVDDVGQCETFERREHENEPKDPRINSDSPESNGRLQREDSLPHPFLQLFGIDNFFDGNKTSDGSLTSGLTPLGSTDSIQFPRDESPVEVRLGENGADNEATLDNEGDTLPDIESTFVSNSVDHSLGAIESEGKTNQGSTKSIGSKDSTQSAGLRLKQHASTSASRISETLRKSVSIEQVSGGVKKVRDLGVHGVKRAADLGVNSAKRAADLGVNSAKRAADLGVNSAKRAADLGVNSAKRAAEFGVQNIQRAPELATKIAGSASAIAPALRSKQDGAPREAGFVVFRDLYTTHAARQMLQYPSAHKMMIEPAPDPDEIFWRNVGLPGEAHKLGRLLSIAATTGLCFFWTIPIAFLSSLTEVNSLKEKLPLLAKWIEAVPSLENIFALLAPLLLLALNEGILPSILMWFSKWEGHIAAPQLEASTFVKLSAFVIIQTFFVSAISGSITAEITNIIDNPEEVVTLLANSLSAQSSYFIQIVLVFTFFSQGLELLRAVPLGMAFARRFVGKNLTAKERRKSSNLFYSLEDPPEFFHAEVLAQIVLFYVVFFVYATIAPIACLFLWLCFLICESGYRYHFIHNNKTSPDSGGKIWAGFIQVLLVSMLIGQLTLMGVLGLKKAVYAVPALAPMLAITILYMILVSPKQMHVSDFLPTIQCVELDQLNSGEHSNVDFLKGEYLQPALKHKRLFPDVNLE